MSLGWVTGILLHSTSSVNEKHSRETYGKGREEYGGTFMKSSVRIKIILELFI